jgi:signal transduction histidine kinase
LSWARSEEWLAQAGSDEAAWQELPPELIVKIFGESGSERHHMRTQQALDQLEQGWAVFDERDRLRAWNAAYASCLNCRAPGELMGCTYPMLLERWLDALAWTSEEQRAAFRLERLQGRSAPHASFDVSTHSGLSLRVTERRAADGWSTSTIVDRTEDARALTELRAELQSCRAAGAAKTEFLCAMSHELRTPLSSMLGFAQLMQRDSKEPLPERQRTRVAYILQGGEHLVHMVDDLLDLSRIEAGRVVISSETFASALVLEQLHSALEPLAQAAGIALQLELPRQELEVVADPARALQILMNFGSNAIKYNRPGGSVRIWAAARAPGQVRATVSDTGIGIPGERCARVFEPFYRAGQERGSIPGTGMGLAISKRLAELMQGAVGFSSISMQGSDFWLDLPAARGAADASS